MGDLYKISVLLLVCFCVIASGRSGTNTRTGKRLSNVEHRLDTIITDISVFRLDINDIWNTLEMLNETVCKTKSTPASSETTEEEQRGSNTQINSAFQNEKQFTRDFMANMNKNFMDFEKEINLKFHQMTEKDDQFKTDLQDKAEFHQQTLNNAMNDMNAEFLLLFKETKQQLQDLTSAFSARTETLEKDLSKCHKLEEENKKCEKAISAKDNDINELKSNLQEARSVSEKLHKSIEKLEKKCPSGWYKRDKSCYILSNSLATWNSAMNWCQRNGGNLVEYSDMDELVFVTTLVKVLSQWKSSVWTGFWTGADDIKHEGQWKWSKSKKSLTFKNWKANQPDNGSGTEHCMVTLVNSNGQWNDEQCYVPYKFVCEMML